jgi:beta-phosphoglucomutase-like phosphatase (HAD superfamily)
VRFLINGHARPTRALFSTASNGYAPRALERAGISVPRAGLVTSDDVIQGKPHPAPYLAGAAKCGVDPTKCQCH